MTQEMAVHKATERAVAEATAIAEKASALETFAGRLDSLSPTRIAQERTSQTVSGPMTAAGGTDKRATIRTAFTETLEPYAEADATLAAIRTELGDGVALALAPTTQTVFTPELQNQLLAAVQSRRKELGVTERALDSEIEQTAAAAETTTDLLAWLRQADQTPLSELGFEELRARHDRLEEWQTALREVAQSRQSFLHGTTSNKGQIGVDNHEIVLSLYEDFEVAHPVLSTTAALETTLRDCRAIVRNHLVRQV